MTNEETKRALIQDLDYDVFPWMVLCSGVEGDELTEILRRPTEDDRREGMIDAIVQAADLERIEFLLSKLPQEA